MNKQENGINKVDIIHKGNEMIVRVPIRMTAAKLEVLNEVCKAKEMELPEFIGYTIDSIGESKLLNSGDIGEALNKRLSNIWQKEIGEDITE